MTANYFLPAVPMIRILKQWAHSQELHWRNDKEYIDYIFELYSNKAVKLN